MAASVAKTDQKKQKDILRKYSPRIFLLKHNDADPLSIVNVFNDFFSTVAQKLQSKIKFSRESFSDFLPPNIHESIILSQITEDQISKIISSLNNSKSTGPNSIPTKILKLLQDQILKHLTHIFNLSLSFTTGIFLIL